MTTEHQNAFSDWCKAIAAEKEAAHASGVASKFANEAMERYGQAKNYTARLYERMLVIARNVKPDRCHEQIPVEPVTVEPVPVPEAKPKAAPPQATPAKTDKLKR